MADELKPEERARIRIDEQLADAGWHIADRGGVTYEHNAIALVEGLLEGNKEADYLLFVDGKVVGVLEAKRSDIDLESAAGGQAANYAHLIPAEYPRWFGLALFPLRRSVMKMSVSGAPFCVRRKVENSFKACSPRLLRSTRKSMRLAGV